MVRLSRVCIPPLMTFAAMSFASVTRYSSCVKSSSNLFVVPPTVPTNLVQRFLTSFAYSDRWAAAFDTSSCIPLLYVSVVFVVIPKSSTRASGVSFRDPILP